MPRAVNGHEKCPKGADYRLLRQGNCEAHHQNVYTQERQSVQGNFHSFVASLWYLEAI